MCDDDRFYNGKVQGRVPRWLLTMGCKGPYYDPVVTTAVAQTCTSHPFRGYAEPPEPQIPLPRFPLPRSRLEESDAGSSRFHCPAVAQTPMPLWQLQGVASRHEAFSFTLSDQQRCMELNRRAHAHLDEFDWDMPPQQHTSALMRHIRFPTPNVSKPIPVTCGSLPGFGEEEWERYDIDTCEGLQKEVKFQIHWWNNENMSERTYYHGAPFGAVVGMIAAGGFIPGPGKCRKGSRRVSGCFCSTDFGDAFSKGTFHQLDFAEVKAKANGDKALNIFCMPCVVEIWPVDLVPPTYMHGNKYCFEPAPDSPACQNVLPGVAIKHVFINRFLFENFLFHHSFPDLSNPLQRRICGQNKSRFTTKDVYQATCGLILESDTKTHVSRTGIWYCRSCTDLHVNHSDHITFARR